MSLHIYDLFSHVESGCDNGATLYTGWICK